MFTEQSRGRDCSSDCGIGIVVVGNLKAGWFRLFEEGKERGEGWEGRATDT